MAADQLEIARLDRPVVVHLGAFALDCFASDQIAGYRTRCKPDVGFIQVFRLTPVKEPAGSSSIRALGP